MPEQHIPRRVEDYTTPFLVSLGVLFFMALFAIWASFGYLTAILIGWGVDSLLKNRAARR